MTCSASAWRSSSRAPLSKPVSREAAGIQFYWRVEHAPTGAPLVYTYVLDPATGRYRDGEIFTSVVKLTVPFFVEVDPGQI